MICSGKKYFFFNSIVAESGAECSALIFLCFKSQEKKVLSQ